MRSGKNGKTQYIMKTDEYGALNIEFVGILAIVKTTPR